MQKQTFVLNLQTFQGLEVLAIAKDNEICQYLKIDFFVFLGKFSQYFPWCICKGLLIFQYLFFNLKIHFQRKKIRI